MKNNFTFLLSISLFLISCTDEIEGLTFEKISPVAAAPLGTVIVDIDSLSDLYDTATFEDVNLKLTDDGSVSLQDINLRLLSENASSKTISVQLYFVDSTATQGNVVIDSLFDGYNGSVIAPAGQADANGNIISPTTRLSDIIVDTEKYERIKSTSKIMLVARLEGSASNANSSNRTKAKSQNSLSISLGFSAQLIIDPEKF